MSLRDKYPCVCNNYKYGINYLSYLSTHSTDTNYSDAKDLNNVCLKGKNNGNKLLISLLLGLSGYVVGSFLMKDSIIGLSITSSGLIPLYMMKQNNDIDKNAEFKYRLFELQFEVYKSQQQFDLLTQQTQNINNYLYNKNSAEDFK